MINEFELAKQVASIGERVDYVAGRITDLGKTLVDHEQWIRKVAHKADHVEMLHNHQAADADDLYLLTERVAKIEGFLDWNRRDALDDLNGLSERVKKLESGLTELVESFAEDIEALEDRVNGLDEGDNDQVQREERQAGERADRIEELEAENHRLRHELKINHTHPDVIDRYGDPWEWVEGYVNTRQITREEEVLSLDQVDEEAGPLKLAQ